MREPGRKILKVDEDDGDNKLDRLLHRETSLIWHMFFLLTQIMQTEKLNVPEAPVGCPNEIAPPFMLVLSISISNSLAQARNCAANASLISTRSISLMDRPALCKACCIAETGPIPIISGAHPVIPYDTSLARGVKLYSFTASSDASNMEPAPSQMPEAFAAVTTPSSLKTGLSLQGKVNEGLVSFGRCVIQEIKEGSR